jgi:hypothetical protein
MTRRLLRALLLATVALLLLPGLARACNEPTVVVLPNVAGPGDTMHYTVSNLTPGGKYELWIDGYQVVPTREARSTSAIGTFPMPDLGDRSRGFSVGGPIEHSDLVASDASPTGDGGYTVKRYDTDGMYRPPAPAPDAGHESQPAPATPPAGAPEDRTPATTQPTGAPHRTGHTHRVTRTDLVTRPTRVPSPTASPVESQAPLDASAHGASVAMSVSHDQQQAVPVSRARNRPSARQPAATPLPERALPPPRTGTTRLPTAGATGRGGPALPLVLVAGLSAAGACAVWLILLLRRGGEAGRPFVTTPAPRIPPDVTIEAELQEILAEERRVRGLTIVLVEQNVGFALGLADRYAVLKVGSVVETGHAADEGARQNVERHLVI